MGTFSIDGTEWGELKRQINRIEELVMEAPDYVDVHLDINVKKEQFDKLEKDLIESEYGTKDYSSEDKLSEE